MGCRSELDDQDLRFTLTGRYRFESLGFQVVCDPASVTAAG